jgi:hypothetical protein
MIKWSEFSKKNFKNMKKHDIKYDHIIESMKNIKSNIINSPDVSYKIEVTKLSLKKIEDLKNSTWVDPDLVYDYLDYDIHIKLNNNNISIKTTKDKFEKIKKRLSVFLKMIDYIYRSGLQNKNFNLYLVLSNNKKNIDDSIISSKHVNSGYTNKTANDIFVWREEEFEKVTFHELIHLINHDHIDENIKIPIYIDGIKSYFEAITDFKAIIYYIIYISILTNIKIKTLLQYEMFFIYNQAKYINSNLQKNKMKQYSPAYSYFILKYKIFYFMTHVDNLNLFEEIFLLNESYKKLIKLMHKNNFSAENDTFINFNSARMTFFELE